MYLNCKVGNEAGMTGCACIYVNSPLYRGKEWDTVVCMGDIECV